MSITMDTSWLGWSSFGLQKLAEELDSYGMKCLEQPENNFIGELFQIQYPVSPGSDRTLEALGYAYVAESFVGNNTYRRLMLSTAWIDPTGKDGFSEYVGDVNGESAIDNLDAIGLKPILMYSLTPSTQNVGFRKEMRMKRASVDFGVAPARVRGPLEVIARVDEHKVVIAGYGVSLYDRHDYDRGPVMRLASHDPAKPYSNRNSFRRIDLSLTEDAGLSSPDTFARTFKVNLG